MNSPNTINFSPDSWGHARKSNGLKSWSLCLCIAVPLLLHLVMSSPNQAIAFAEKIEQECSPSNSLDPDFIRVQQSEPAYFSLWKAESYLPWESVIEVLSTQLGENGFIELIHFDSEASTFIIRGKVTSVDSIPELMLSLQELEWLSEPDPFEIDLQGEEGWYSYALRLKVQPYIQLSNSSLSAMEQK